MEDSSSYSSLLALVDDHLSKTRIQAVDSSSEETGTRTGAGIKIPSLHTLQNITQSESSLPQLSGQRLPMPSFGLSQSPIKNVLAEQIANMLKAKERKQKEEEERLRLQLEAVKVEEETSEDCVIDLVKALSAPFERSQLASIPDRSSSSSMESLFEPQLIDFVSEFQNDTSVPEPLLPCSTDMSFILKQKIAKGKCSSFGKVLISRYKPTAAPYFREKLKSDIMRFDFKTNSPCDIIKEKLRKTGYNTYPMEFAPQLKLLTKQTIEQNH